ncbi:MAG TPA: hypothetical protein VFP50_07080, partial [Anaeromyxobacteraceae bacterium]|nr:hypothetical protein [Anaeromyxobacteraceae bacterium]
METKPKPTAPRPVLGLVALAGAALVAVLAWKAWEVTREADALARPPAAPATPLVLAPPPAAP